LKDHSAKEGNVIARISKHAVVEKLHEIITLLLRCFNGWLKPLRSGAEKETVSPIQDRDPYLESLLIALHGRK
jgi:hypothetical protein